MDARIKRKLRPLISMAVIGFFIFLAFASIGPDGSTNETVDISDCESEDNITVKFDLTVVLKDESGVGIVGAKGRAFLTHQKVKPDGTCTYTLTQDMGNIITGPSGLYHFEGLEYMHDNSKDLFRVEVIMDDGIVPYLYFGDRETQVKYYNSGKFTFIFKAINPL